MKAPVITLQNFEAPKDVRRQLQIAQDSPAEQWEALVIVEEKETDDSGMRRIAHEGAIDWRTQQPVSVAWPSHDDNEIVALATRFERRGLEIWAYGHYASNDHAEAFKAAVEKDEAGWPSVELGSDETTISELEDGTILIEFDIAKITGLAIVRSPAQEGTFIRRLETEAQVAAGSSLPPREWFSDPELEGPTPLIVTDEGRVFGHLALWDSCHISHADACLQPPHSEAEYAYFLTGEIETSEGTVPVGQIVVGTDHASLSTRGLRAADHYANTGTAVADIFVGEDAFGPWVAGAIRPEATPEQIQVLRASALSGDWRRLHGNLELVALLAVNTPGYPVPRRAFVASGKQTALVSMDLIDPHRFVVSSFADLPLADRDYAWDGSGAAQRVRDFYTDDDGNTDWEKVHAAFMYHDPDAADTITGHKLGFADITDGSLKAVFRGLAAIAGGRGVDAADIPSGEKDRIKNHVCRYYSKAREAFEDDSITCPFEEEESTSKIDALEQAIRPLALAVLDREMSSQ